MSPLAIAASVQLACATPNFLVQEHNEANDTRVGGRTLIGAGYFAEPFVVGDDGCVAVPEKPGLGVELDPAGMELITAKAWHSARA